MVRAGQSSDKAALIYQHSDGVRQREVADGIDDPVRAQRAGAAVLLRRRVLAQRSEQTCPGLLECSRARYVAE